MGTAIIADQIYRWRANFAINRCCCPADDLLTTPLFFFWLTAHCHSLLLIANYHCQALHLNRCDYIVFWFKYFHKHIITHENWDKCVCTAAVYWWWLRAVYRGKNCFWKTLWQNYFFVARTICYYRSTRSSTFDVAQFICHVMCMSFRSWHDYVVINDCIKP